MEAYKQLRLRQREARIAATLPATIGEDAITATAPIREMTTGLSTRLGLVQTALSMVLEGRARATVTEVTDRAADDFEVFILPSVGGQIFSDLGVRRVSVHGQRRLILEAESLQAVHDDLVGQMERLKPQVEAAAEKFERSTETVQVLEGRMSRIYQRASHEKELRAFIIKYEQEGRGANEWQSRYDGLKARIQRGEELKAACQELEAKIAELGSPEEMQKVLEEKLRDHESRMEELAKRDEALEKSGRDVDRKEAALEKKLEELDQRERALLGRFFKYDVREGVVETGEVKKELKERKKELARLDRELGKKRGMLARLRGKD